MAIPSNSRVAGVVLVECALVLPLFFFLVLATFDACRFVAQQAALDHAVRAGGQFASELDAGDCVTPARDWVLAASRTFPFASPVAVNASITTLADGTRVLSVGARWDGNRLFSMGAGVNSAVTYPLEYQGACTDRLQAGDPAPTEASGRREGAS